MDMCTEVGLGMFSLRMRECSMAVDRTVNQNSVFLRAIGGVPHAPVISRIGCEFSSHKRGVPDATGGVRRLTMFSPRMRRRLC